MTEGRANSGLLLGSALLLDSDTFLRGGALFVERGRVVRVLSRVPRRLPASVWDLRPSVLLPGLVDAHAHLDLTRTRVLAPGATFAGWLRRVIAARRSTRASEVQEAVAEGASLLLRRGTTAVADVDGTGGSLRALALSPLRATVLLETIAPSPGEASGAAQAARGWIEIFPRTPRVRPGLAPHAPYTASVRLYGLLGRLARERGVPLSTHLAETAEEVALLVEGRGPLRELLEERGRIPRGWRPPGLRPLALLEAAGALGPGTVLAHGNYLTREECARVARAGATVVLCPGTHRFFGRSGFPAKRLLDAGVRIALGTDGLACNDALDLFLEMARFRALEPGVAPAEVFRAATESGALALRLGPCAGTLRPGAPADAIAVEAPAGSGREGLLDFLTSQGPAVRAVFVGARPVLSVDSERPDAIVPRFSAPNRGRKAALLRRGETRT